MITTAEVREIVEKEPSPWTGAHFYGATVLGTDGRTQVLVMCHLSFVAPGLGPAPMLPNVNADVVRLGTVKLDRTAAIGVARDLDAWKWPEAIGASGVFGDKVILPGAQGVWTPEQRSQSYSHPRLVMRRMLTGPGRTFQEVTTIERFEQVANALQRGSPTISGLRSVAEMIGIEDPDFYAHMGGNLQYMISARLPVRLELTWSSDSVPTAIVILGSTIDPQEVEFSVADGNFQLSKVGAAFQEEVPETRPGDPVPDTRIFHLEYAALKTEVPAYLWWRGWKVAEFRWLYQEDHLDVRHLDVAAAMAQHGQPPAITARELLKWFGAARRGSRVEARIRKELARRDLVTVPDFMGVWIDELIEIRRSSAAKPANEVEEDVEPNASDVGASTGAMPRGRARSPIRLIGELPTATRGVVSVKPGASLQYATTLMMYRKFSQLPIMPTDYQCKGAISWESIASKAALGRECKVVDDCMIVPDQVEQMSGDTDLLAAIPRIAASGFALIKEGARFVGIVTVADLSIQFRDLSEPFLLLEQIEMLLRSRVQASFTVEEMRGARDPKDVDRIINDASDLTFGEYVRLIQPVQAWPKLELKIDRSLFVQELEKVRDFRNEVMHFNPRPAAGDDVDRLRAFARLLKEAIWA